MAKGDESEMKLHIGCGARLEAGWVNIDVMPCPFPDTKPATADYLQCDVTAGIPVSHQRVTHVYCEHFLEHLTLQQGEALVKAVHALLLPGGVFRVSVPSLEVLVEKYMGKDLRYAGVVGWLPGTAAQLLNEGMRWWGHQFMYDAPELIRILQTAGFSTIQRMGYRDSRTEAMLLEHRPDLGELIFECVK